MPGGDGGKTRTGVEGIKYIIQNNIYQYLSFIAPTTADTRDVMIEGPSGIMKVFPPEIRPLYIPSKRRLEFPNGAQALLFSSEEPERLRGPQTEFVWGDEVGSWKHMETYDNAMLGLRLGNNPRSIFTTTPKPTKLIRQLVKDPNTFITNGTTYDNRVNLASAFYKTIITRYEGTRIGRQELEAKLLEDVEGALWNHTQLDLNRLQKEQAPALQGLVISVDPAATSKKTSNETGIVVCGSDGFGEGFVLDDVSLRGTPHEWANAAVKAYYFWEADYVVAEANNGGEMVKHTIQTIDANVPVKMVYASRGKKSRAEPISALYEQGKIHHVGSFPFLEDQMCSWIPNDGQDSPDRMDALVWGMTELLMGKKKKRLGKMDLQSLGKTSYWNLNG